MANPADLPAPDGNHDDQPDISAITSNMTRMENGALLQQRVELTERQVAQMNMLAVSAKLERALKRRMSGQDAVMRPRDDVALLKTELASDPIPIEST